MDQRGKFGTSLGHVGPKGLFLHCMKTLPNVPDFRGQCVWRPKTFSMLKHFVFPGGAAAVCEARVCVQGTGVQCGCVWARNGLHGVGVYEVRVCVQGTPLAGVCERR